MLLRRLAACAIFGLEAPAPCAVVAKRNVDISIAVQEAGGATPNRNMKRFSIIACLARSICQAVRLICLNLTFGRLE